MMASAHKGDGGPTLSPTLKRIPAEALKLLKAAQTPGDVAKVLEVPWGKIKYLVYDLPPSKQYKSWTIPKKSGGTRLIESPLPGISILQDKLVSILSTAYQPGPWVTAFVKGRSVPKNAAMHCRRRWVLNIDLEDFYGSIHFGRIRGLLMRKPYEIGAKAASVIAHILTHHTHLPQGAPSSPLISNLVAWALDRKLINLAKKYKLTYSRYADDITFSSTNSKVPEPLISWTGATPTNKTIALGSELLNAITSAGFKVNASKIRLQFPSTRQEVTGLTVNQVPNVERKYIRNLRAMLNSWEKRGLPGAENYHLDNFSAGTPNIPKDKRNGLYFKSVVYGHMAWLKSVSGSEGQVYLKLCTRLAMLDSNPPAFIQLGKEKFQVYDFFICHAGEDKEKIATPIYDGLEASGFSVFIDDKIIKWGDSFVAKINEALGRSKFVIAIISKNSAGKAWPQKEINAVVANELAKNKMQLLPIMVGSKEQIRKILDDIPLLGDRNYHHWNGDVATVVKLAGDRLKT